MGVIASAHLLEDGSCRLDSEGVDGRPVTTTWQTVREWALEWCREYESSEFGPACEFANVVTSDPVDGAVDLLVRLADVAAETGQEMVDQVGAGPVEDLVSHSGHGRRTVDAVEAAAGENPNFARSLRGVWLGRDVPQDVRDRLTRLGAVDLG